MSDVNAASRLQCIFNGLPRLSKSDFQDVVNLILTEGLDCALNGPSRVKADLEMTVQIAYEWLSDMADECLHRIPDEGVS